MARIRSYSRRMATYASVRASSDFISNMPDLVIDKIFKHLTLDVAAKTNILSRTWRRNWLSCNYLMFDHYFWIKFWNHGVYDWQKGSSVINNILIHHDGCIHSFYLDLRPSGLVIEKYGSLSQLLSLLSRTCPKKITLINWANEWSSLVRMPSYIFQCTELTELKLHCFALRALPFDFKGFPYLRTLELLHIILIHDIDMLWSLVRKCPCLVCLRMERCSGMDRLYVDAPMLGKLAVRGEFDSFSLKNCPRLVDVSLCSTKVQLNETETVAATIKSLATSNELQCLGIGGTLCKFLAARWVNKSLPLAFNNLNRLCLLELILSDPDVLRITIGMIRSCPFIKELQISVSSKTVVVQQKYEYTSDNYKLDMLRDAKITGITGSTAELKLIEYVLTISVVLEKLIINFGAVVDGSKFNVARELLQFPRASPKARLICLDK